MRFRSVVIAYTLWLTANFGVLYLAHGKGYEQSLQVVLLCGVVPAGLQLLFLGVDWRGLVAPVKLWLVLMLVIVLSYLVNVMDPQFAPNSGAVDGIPAAWGPIVYTLNTIFILAIGTLVAGCPDRRLLRSIASLFCILNAPLLIYVDLTGKMLWGRLVANDLEPNMWGLMGLTVCVAALARKVDLLAVVSFIAGAITMLQASSREHIVALVAILMVVAALHLKDVNRPRLLALMAVSCVVLVAATVLFDPYVLNAINYIDTNVLLLNSPQRGLDSGFTGRTDVWAWTIELWLKSPLLGVGFRRHEQFILVPAHNAYLAMLADTGILGLLIFLFLLVASLGAAWGMRDPRTRRFVMSVLVGYVVIGFFDRRTINGGNPYSLFFLMCCSLALADWSVRRMTVLGRRHLAEQAPLAVPTHAGRTSAAL